MPLLDHFHPPVSQRHPWESFLAAWASNLAGILNRRVLSAKEMAALNVHCGGPVEPDITAADTPSPAWMPPAAHSIVSTVFPDEFEVQVFHTFGGNTLVGVIEFVSPGNKDRTETRRAFALKCVAYLQQGIGLILVDIVTSCVCNLHDELIRLLQQPAHFGFPQPANLYTVAYRPSRKPAGDQIEIWPVPLTLGPALPIMPLALRRIGTIPIDLETTYRTACEDTRL